MKKCMYALGIIVALFLVLSMQGSANAAKTTSTPSTFAQSTASCQAQGAYPDPQCTPGAVFSNVDATQVCTPGYTKGVRNVPQSEKNQVYANYGIASHTPGQYEVDHFIPLELGGSNDISNLWPEPAQPTPGFHEKDKVENYLHSQVCSGAMSLSDAQKQISTDWVSVYNSMSALKLKGASESDTDF